MLGQIFFDAPYPLSYLLLRFIETSMLCSYGSATVGFFFFFLAGGVGEEAAGLVTFGGSSGAGSGSTGGVGSGTDEPV